MIVSCRSRRSSRSFDLLFAANRRLILPRESCGTLVQIFHGVSFRNRAVRDENLAFEVLFLVGPYMRRQFVERGLLGGERPARAVDRLSEDRSAGQWRDRPRRRLARYGFDGSRPVLLYAPTGEADNSLETMGEAVISALAATGRFDLLVKPHDHPKNAAMAGKPGAAREPPHPARRDADVVPLLAASDLLLTDASSVANEYTLLDRPIVFIDVPALLARARFRARARSTSNSWGRKGGVVARDPPEVAAAVADGSAERSRQSAVRRAIASDLFYNPGHATDAAMAWLEQRWLRPRKLAS